MLVLSSSAKISRIRPPNASKSQFLTKQLDFSDTYRQFEVVGFINCYMVLHYFLTVNLTVLFLRAFTILLNNFIIEVHMLPSTTASQRKTPGDCKINIHRELCFVTTVWMF